MNEPIVGAALAVLAYFAVWIVRSLKGISRKVSKVVAFLIRYVSEDLSHAEARRELTAIIEGK